MGAPETITYLHTDHLGTPRKGSNQSGASVWSWDSDAFGVGNPTGSRTVNLRMAGQYADDESGLFYNWNRYYDPQTGRYISSDPIGLGGGLNTFSYVSANPVMFTDPEGLHTVVCMDGQPCGFAEEGFEIAFGSVLECLYSANPYQCIYAGAELACGAKIAGAVGEIGGAVIGKIAGKLPKSLPKDAVNPFAIRFSQDDIRKSFADTSKGTIDDLTKGLRDGSISPDDIPPIRVFENSDGVLQSLDNRRLKAFQDANTPIRTIPATPEEIAEAVKRKKFSSKNGEVTIRIRGQKN